MMRCFGERKPLKIKAQISVYFLTSELFYLFWGQGEGAGSHPACKRVKAGSTPPPRPHVSIWEFGALL